MSERKVGGMKVKAEDIGDHIWLIFLVPSGGTIIYSKDELTTQHSYRRQSQVLKDILGTHIIVSAVRVSYFPHSCEEMAIKKQPQRGSMYWISKPERAQFIRAEKVGEQEQGRSHCVWTGY